MPELLCTNLYLSLDVTGCHSCPVKIVAKTVFPQHNLMGSIRQQLRKNSNFPTLACFHLPSCNTFQKDAWLHSAPEFPSLAIHLSCLISPPVFPPAHMAGGVASLHIPTPPHTSLPLLPPAYESLDINWRTKAPECHGWFRSFIPGLVPRQPSPVQCGQAGAGGGGRRTVLLDVNISPRDARQGFISTSTVNISESQHVP